jgi:hypothetical protein
MIRRILVLISIIIIPLAGCGYYDTGKEMLVDKPLDSSKRKQELLNAREGVEKSRRDYENCLKKNPVDESTCESYKTTYEQNVETYSSLQSQ